MDFGCFFPEKYDILGTRKGDAVFQLYVSTDMAAGRTFPGGIT